MLLANLVGTFCIAFSVSDVDVKPSPFYFMSNVVKTRGSAIVEGPHEVLSQLKSCYLLQLHFKCRAIGA